MSLKQKQNGLNRTKWENKTDNQKRKLLDKHYNNLGKNKPKYLEGHITNSQLNRALNTLQNEYNRQIKKEGNINTQYTSMKRQINKLIKSQNNKILSGRTPLEKSYLGGESINIPTLRQGDIIADKTTFKPIGKEQFRTLKAKEQRTKQLKGMLQKIKSKGFTDSDLFNDRTNIKTFVDIMKQGQFDESEQVILSSLFSNLSSFEQEIFVKNALGKLRDIYLVEGEDDIEEKTQEKMFNAMYGIMRGIVKDNRGYDVGVSAKGTFYEL